MFGTYFTKKRSDQNELSRRTTDSSFCFIFSLRRKLHDDQMFFVDLSNLKQHPTAQVAPSFRAQTRKSGIESGSDSSLRLPVPRRGYHPGSRVIRQASKPFSGLVLIFGFPHTPLLLAPRYRCFAATRATRYDTVRAAAVPVAVQRRSGSPTPFRRKESTRRGCLRHCINATFL